MAALASNLCTAILNETYRPRNADPHPAAAFDVIDFDPEKTSAVAASVGSLGAALVAAASDRPLRSAIR